MMSLCSLPLESFRSRPPVTSQLWFKNVPHHIAFWGGLTLAFSLSWTIAVTNISFAVVAIAYLWPAEYGEKWRHFKSSKMSFLAVALFFLTVGSAVYSKADWQFIEHDIHKYAKLLLIPMLDFFFRSLKDKKLLLYAFLAGFSVLISSGFVNLWQSYLVTGNIYQILSYKRIFSSYITEGMFLASFIFICLVLLADNINKKRYVLFIPVLLATFHAFLLDGRMGLIILVLAFLLFFWIKLKSVKRRLVAVSLTLILAFISYNYSPNIKQRVDRTVVEAKQFLNGEYDRSPRAKFYLLSIEMIKRSPIIGNGPGSFMQALANDPSFSHLREHTHAHNQFLSMWSLYGVLGLALFLALTFYGCWPYLRYRYHTLSVVVFGATIIFLVECVTDSVFTNALEGTYFCFLLSLTPKKHQLDQTDRAF